MFDKILIANRGEIACRVIKTARKMGIKSVAVYSSADRRALHVRMADEAVYIGDAPSSASYLCGDIIIRAAIDSGAQAVHPCYGFLSENAEFASDCKAAGLVFIGASAAAISSMGLKDRAKDIMRGAGVPVVAGYQGCAQGNDFLATKAGEIGYPILIKAVAGGGGKGMRQVHDAQEFIPALEICQREGRASFGNDHILLEKYLTNPRHIEVQIFGDSHGNIVHLFERDCSLQRRHQKVVEEAPAPNISDTFRKDICIAAVCAAKAIDYQGAGTVEFIVQGDDFYFMEMNTRLQVEHTVTEMITGLDLVEWQLRVAAGEKLPLSQDDITISGHAFEARLYAEDPAQDFLPQTGRVNHFLYPAQNKYMRIDAGVETGDNVSIYYDPMVAKLISWGDNRGVAAQNMAELLSQTYVCGPSSNSEFLSNIFTNNAFIGDGARIDTGFIIRHEQELLPQNYGKAGHHEIALAALYYLLGLGHQLSDANPWGENDNWRIGADIYRRSINLVNKGKVIAVNAKCDGSNINLEGIGDVSLISYEDGTITALIDDIEISAKILSHRGAITIFYQGRVVDLHRFSPELDGDDITANDGRILAPMPGKIVKLSAELGAYIETGQSIVVMESMKVQIPITSNCEGVIVDVFVKIGTQVSEGTLLAVVKPQEGGGE